MEKRMLRGFRGFVEARRGGVPPNRGTLLELGPHHQLEMTQRFPAIPLLGHELLRKRVDADLLLPAIAPLRCSLLP